ncbi:IS3 family transposase [Streptomyces sp. NBC_01511]|uniref:IS3 family transposase n=1 Tax=Streptomyces sp. NBC_01511 TaxID=2903889 RepID=UPI00386C9A62
MEKATEHNPGGFSIAALCRVLEIGRSLYYGWLAAWPSAAARQEAEDELAAEIRQIYTASRGAYGAPRVTAKRRRAGRRINRKKIERIMRERDIRGIPRMRRNLTKAALRVQEGNRRLGSRPRRGRLPRRRVLSPEYDGSGQPYPGAKPLGEPTWLRRERCASESSRNVSASVPAPYVITNSRGLCRLPGT